MLLGLRSIFNGDTAASSRQQNSMFFLLGLPCSKRNGIFLGTTAKQAAHLGFGNSASIACFICILDPMMFGA